jgi:hypothetical protein
MFLLHNLGGGKFEGALGSSRGGYAPPPFPTVDRFWMARLCAARGAHNAPKRRLLARAEEAEAVGVVLGNSKTVLGYGISETKNPVWLDIDAVIRRS